MAHAVHYQDAAGTARFELFDGLDAALETVERLRNDGQASDVRVFREVPIEVRTYYRVVAVDEGQGDAPVADPVQSATPIAPVASLADAPSLGEPLSGAVVMTPPPVTVHPEVDTPEQQAQEPRRPLFSRG